MAAYRRVYDSRHLHADCKEPGSAPEPYARQSSMGYLYLYASRNMSVFSLLLCKGQTVRVCICGPAPADVDRHVLPVGRPAANLPHATAAVDRWDYTENGDTDRHQTVT